MKEFKIVPSILMMDTAKELYSAYSFSESDLVFISDSTKKRWFHDGFENAIVVNYRQFGNGEPSDEFVNDIIKYIGNKSYDRVFAIGGGTILDVAKLFALEKISPVCDLFQKKFPAKKTKELVLIPTTCGTGSEVTNISILELKALNTKMGLADDTLYADTAVLIPELIKELPYSVFAASSIDALIHAFESFLSPKASPFTKFYAKEAITLILKGYCSIRKMGTAVLSKKCGNFLLASTYAGISFGNAGCAAVHAMSYPLGAKYHVPHGEANYVFFIEIFKTYVKLDPYGNINELLNLISHLLYCNTHNALEELEELLSTILPHKKLISYGVKQNDLEEFTQVVITKQGRLMGNNYTELSERTISHIYQSLFK